MKKGYIPKDQRKKILLMCDDIRTHSGIATVAREIVIHTSHHFNFVNVGAAIEHPEAGKKLDISVDTSKEAGIEDASVTIYPIMGTETHH
jgi:cobalamin biosynthesis Co2+ chelatase CbiK